MPKVRYILPFSVLMYHYVGSYKFWQPQNVGLF